LHVGRDDPGELCRAGDGDAAVSRGGG
jgi:hypothetical protein